MYSPKLAHRAGIESAFNPSKGMIESFRLEGEKSDDKESESDEEEKSDDDVEVSEDEDEEEEEKPKTRKEKQIQKEALRLIENTEQLMEEYSQCKQFADSLSEMLAGIEQPDKYQHFVA